MLLVVLVLLPCFNSAQRSFNENYRWDYWRIFKNVLNAVLDGIIEKERTRTEIIRVCLMKQLLRQHFNFKYNYSVFVWNSFSHNNNIPINQWLLRLITSFKTGFLIRSYRGASLSYDQGHVQAQQLVSPVAPAAVSLANFLLLNHTRDGQHEILRIKLASLCRYAYYLLNLLKAIPLNFSNFLQRQTCSPLRLLDLTRSCSFCDELHYWGNK